MPDPARELCSDRIETVDGRFRDGDNFPSCRRMGSTVADCMIRHVRSGISTDHRARPLTPERAEGGPGMSAYEPDTATSGGGADSTRPRFQLARRGYDRQQVDRYVMELIALIEQQHQRAEHAERLLEQARSEMDDGGERQPP